MTGYCILDHFVRSGHEVGVLYLESSDQTQDQGARAKTALSKMGVTFVESVPHHFNVPGPGVVAKRTVLSSARKAFPYAARRLTSRIRYRPEAFQRWARLTPLVKAQVDRFQPDVCLLYGFEPIQAFLGVQGAPKVAGLGTFQHNIERIRLSRAFDRRPLRQWLFDRCLFPVWERHYFQSARDLIRSVDAAWFFTENYARFCRERLGLKGVIYLPNPAQDEQATSPVEQRPPPAHSPFQVAMVGHLAGTATRSGLKYFAEKVMPALERRGLADKFEFQIIGKFSPPEWLAKRLRRPNIKFVGFVDDFGSTINQADALLVPIPDDVGNRVRIVSAFSAEACVVTHASSCLGMPELTHGGNCLVGNDPEALVTQLLEACSNRELNSKLRAGGRKTYLEHYHPNVACKKIEEFVRAALLKDRTTHGRELAESTAPVQAESHL